MKNLLKWTLCISCIAISCSIMTACSKDKSKQQTTEQAVPVTAVRLIKEKVDLQYHSVGSLKSKVSPIIKSQISGHVEAILVEEGQKVTTGQTLIQLSQERELIAFKQAETNYIKAQSVYNERKLTVERRSSLVRSGVVSKSQYDAALAEMEVAKAELNVANYRLYNSQYNLTRTQIISPVNGVIQKILTSTGNTIQPGTPLIEINTRAKMRASLPFSETQVSLLKPGQKVSLYSPTNPHSQLTGRVTAITPAINPKNRSINVIVEFDNHHGWRSGASVHGTVFANNAFEAVIVPTQSIVQRPQGLVVYVVKNNKAEARPVTLGYEAEDWAAVTKGLHAGDIAIVDGASYMSNGTPVKARILNPAKKVTVKKQPQKQLTKATSTTGNKPK